MRSAVPKQVRIKQSSGSTWSTIAGSNLGQGTTAEPANPTEEMANAITREIGYMYNANVLIKPSGAISAYRAMYIAAASPQAEPTGTDDVNWTYIGRLDNEGSITYTPRTRTDAALKPVYRGTNLEVVLNPLDVAKHPDIVAFNGQQVDIALERIDGTYRWFKNLTLSLAALNPTAGTDRTQTVRVRAVGAAFDVASFLGDGLDTIFTTLNVYQKAGDLVDIEYTFDDDSVVTVVDAGFTVVPVESYAQASLIGYQVTAVGYGASEGQVLTVSPAFT